MKYLNELTTDELKKVYENNKSIRGIASELYADCIWDYVTEYVSYFNTNDVDICFDRYNYPVIHVNIAAGFMKGLKNIAKDFALFNNEEEKKITEFEILLNSLADYDYDSDEYTDCETKIELVKRELVDILTKILRNEIDCIYNDDDVLDYFLFDYANIFAEDYNDVYVDDDYIAYKTITKCYK